MEVKKDVKTAGLLRRGSTSRRAKGTARPIQTLVYLGEREERGREGLGVGVPRKRATK
jgi:hypothetical protein